MIPLQFETAGREGLDILCLGAHCDDIEIGCGGALLKLMGQYPVRHVRWVVFASNAERKQEALRSAEAFLEKAESRDIAVLDYRDAFLQFSALEIKEYFESVKREFNPNLVFTHYRDDRHQDHRLISDLAWNTFRDHLILEYEIPKYDGDLGAPNCFVHLTEEQASRKVELLMSYFASQKKKHWFDKETFLALLRIRGMESASPTRYAEAFHLRKMVL
ncbi:MAG: PIG-L family deacetylase [Lewinellaceae bacterium]|nr:PIG-L family deacetylase [Phaeodactylibacter sp.]MCB9035963.1 PIG-L family deacetylase [Lewinellaceae bacterium]